MLLWTIPDGRYMNGPYSQASRAEARVKATWAVIDFLQGPCLIRGVQADRGGLAPVLLSWRYSRRLRFIKRAFHYRGGNYMALLDLSECYAPKKYFQTAQKASQATKA